MKKHSTSRQDFTMRTLLWTTADVRARCFKPSDLDRLKAETDLAICPDPSDPAVRPSAMIQWYEQHAAHAQMVITGWGTPALTDDLLDQSPNLKLLAHSAGSFHHLLPGSFWSRNIRLTSCNEAIAVGVAETTLGMMIAGIKGFVHCTQLTRQGQWKTAVHDGANPPGYVPREMYEITIGLISASKVGRQVIRLLENFEVNVLVYDPFLTEDQAQALGVEKVELMDLMARSEIVSLHAPFLPATQHLLKAEHFAAMQDQSIFINTARGVIVDQPALVKELATGRFFAYLDVTDPEPPAPDHPLRSMPNVMLTPHIAGGVSNGLLRLGRQVVDTAIALKQGQPLPGEVTEAIAAQMA